MSEETEVQAKRAATQAKHAAKNGAEVIGDVAEEAVAHINVMAGVQCFGALCVAAYAAGFAVSKAQQVFISK